MFVDFRVDFRATNRIKKILIDLSDDYFHD